ncbi:hypothetical protein YC2023_117140 [Brassica napus]
MNCYQYPYFLYCPEKGDGIGEALRFVPSRGVLLMARGNPSRVYNPLCSFLPPNGFLTFLFFLSLLKIFGDLHYSSLVLHLQKLKAEVGPSESMDSSGSSLDLTAELENPSCVVALPVVEVDRFRPVGPLSTIGVEEVSKWREKYHLSDDVAIRFPGPIDRVSDFEVHEVPVYEGFFESGFRDRVPSLMAKVSEALEISPGQLNPPSWNLIAMLNLGDLEDLTIGSPRSCIHILSLL